MECSLQLQRRHRGIEQQEQRLASLEAECMAQNVGIATAESNIQEKLALIKQKQVEVDQAGQLHL